MRTRLAPSSCARRSAVLAVAVGLATAALAIPAAAATRTADVQIAKTAVFVLADFPDGFSTEPASDSTNADNIRLAKGVGGCAPYVALQKATAALPQARSLRFVDESRTVSNEVGVFKTARAASDALALFAKPSIVGCLKKLFEKQLRQDPALRGKLDTVEVSLERQDIAGLGDDSVVYEGKIVLAGTDGSTEEVGVGNAAVRVGRAVDVVTYTTEGADLTEILTPAIDASVGRLRTALLGDTA
jgi:hypothetical protein